MFPVDSHTNIKQSQVLTHASFFEMHFKQLGTYLNRYSHHFQLQEQVFLKQLMVRKNQDAINHRHVEIYNDISIVWKHV